MQSLARRRYPSVIESKRTGERPPRTMAPPIGNQAALRRLAAAAPVEVRRKCAACEEEEKGQVQMKSAGGAATSGVAPAAVHEALAAPGRPLDAASRGFFEPRFGQDFAAVRIHEGSVASRSAREIHALAYTVGQHIVLGAGGADQRLLAHELAHTVQQSGDAGATLQRQADMEPTDVPASAVIRDAPKAKSWTGAPAKCGPDFCRPLASDGMALDTQKKLWPILMLGIGHEVSWRVVPLWNQWAFGGSSTIIDITKDFGADFTTSPTTAKTTAFLVSRIKAKLTASPPALSGGSAKLDVATLIPSDVKAIDDPASTNQMNFNFPNDIPGNLAGGIGKDEAANPIGAQPSPQNDARIVKGDVTVVDGGANLMVIPNLSYRVLDTIDLCPGDCGTSKEQIATIPMSQWEATGISGDVPFTVDFPALAPPFTIPKPGGPAAPAVAPPAAPPAPAPPHAAPSH